MYTKNKIVRVCALLLSAFLVFACFDGSAPIVTEPQTLPPSPTPIPIPVEATLTPFPPLLPDATFTQPPSILPADTLVPTIVSPPTNTPLPPAPDFGQVLSFGFGGGAGHTCMVSEFPPPVAYVARGRNGAHVAGLCVYDIALPINVPIHMALISPDGTILIQGDFQFWGEQYSHWIERPEYKGYDGYAGNCDTASCRNWGLEFWWPANLPENIWQVHLSWNGGDVFGTFHSIPTLPELTVHDALVFSELRPVDTINGCHPVASATGYMVAGRGFPANTVIYVPVFEQVEGTQQARFLNTQIFVSDGNGAIYGALTGPFQSGKRYAIAGVTDATLPLLTPDALANSGFNILGDAADCFFVP
jgi:hypothetical protein